MDLLKPKNCVYVLRTFRTNLSKNKENFSPFGLRVHGDLRILNSGNKFIYRLIRRGNPKNQSKKITQDAIPCMETLLVHYLALQYYEQCNLASASQKRKPSPRALPEAVGVLFEYLGADLGKSLQ